MPRTAASKGGAGCTICADPHRDAIDGAIASGALSLARIAEQFSVSVEALKRHRRNHPRADLATLTPDAPDIAPGVGALLDVPAQLLAQFSRTLEAVKAAEKTRSFSAMADANREHRQTLEAVAKWNLEQQRIEALKARPQAISVARSAEWLHLRLTISDFFDSHQQWRGVCFALVDALAEVEAMTPEQHERWLAARMSGNRVVAAVRQESDDVQSHDQTTDSPRPTEQFARPVPTRPEQRDAVAPADGRPGTGADGADAVEPLAGLREISVT